MVKWDKKAWDRIFRKEGKIFVKVHEYMGNLVKQFKKRKVKRVLDLGCGTGRHVIYLAKKGFEVYGLDISAHGIKTTKEWLKKEKLKASLRIGDIYKKLPYKNNFFDAVISVQTLHHARIRDIRRLIKEIERVLKPGGLIFVTVTKRRPKKLVPKERLWKMKLIAPRTYIPLTGDEKGLIHYYFNKKLLRKEFGNFKIHDIWVDKSYHYALLGELKKL